MKRIIITILTAVLLTTAALAQQPAGVLYDIEIVRVIDGDTIVFKAPFLPAPLKPELSIRVFGVDTPEKSFRAKCASEKARGEAASAFTKKVIANSKNHQVILYKWDKYGGRVLGDVILDDQSLRYMLIQNGFAREYYGDSKQSWCN